MLQEEKILSTIESMPEGEIPEIYRAPDSGADGTHPISELPKTPEMKQPFPITPAEIRFGDRYAVVHGVVKGLDQRIKPSVDIACALISKTTEEELIRIKGYYKYDTDGLDLLEQQQNELPWPESAKIQPSKLPQVDPEWLDIHRYNVIKERVSKTFVMGVDDGQYDESALEQVMDQVFKRLSHAEQQKVVEWVHQLDEQGYDMPMGNDLFFARYEGSWRYPHQQIIEGLLRYHHNYLYNRFDHHSQEQDTTQEWKPFTSLSWDDFRPDSPLSAQLFLDEVISRNPEEQEVLLGIAVNHFDLPNVITAIRKALQEENYTQEEKHDLETLGRKVLGITNPTLPFHTDLNSVYASLKDYFNEYQPNLEAQNAELKLIQTTIQKLVQEHKDQKGIPQEGITVVDLGCGTGRIAIGLAQEVRGVREIKAIDASDDLLQVAADEYQKAETITTPVTFQHGDWNGYEYVHDEKGRGKWKSNLGLQPHSADAIICIGRTLTHAEDKARFKTILEQMYESLRDNGIVIFDFPDPNKGAYLENRQHLLHALQQLGLPITDDYLPQLEYVVDSADGENMYNRYVPQFDHLREILRYHGFTLEELARSPIGGDLWTGSENVYFAARKLPLKEKREIQFKHNFPILPQPEATLSSLSEHSVSGNPLENILTSRKK